MEVESCIALGTVLILFITACVIECRRQVKMDREIKETLRKASESYPLEPPGWK